MDNNMLVSYNMLDSYHMKLKEIHIEMIMCFDTVKISDLIYHCTLLWTAINTLS